MFWALQAVAAFAAALLGWTASAHAFTSLFTDLGGVGNATVARTFADYQRKLSNGCRPVAQGPRVIVTGFGLFFGIDYNISGAVVQSMANENAWPASIDLAKDAPLPAKAELRKGLLAETDRGARTVNRALAIDGRTYSVCFIVLDVLWDLAGAIVAHEMERFHPDFVLMTGRGGISAVVEAGALNTATALPGYRSSGNSDHDNRPQSDWILEDTQPGASKEIAMTWSQKAVAARIEPLIKELGWSLEVPTSARSNNDYICNNVSYIALQAATNRILSLAGGELVIRPWILRPPKIGFMHLPDGAAFTPREIAGWGRVISAAIFESTMP